MDSQQELTRILQAVETDKTTGERQTTYYTYGKGLLAQEDEKNEYRLYHFNHLGSTTLITDESGQVVETFEYNPYGELLDGEIGEYPFLFNGEYGVVTDTNGLYYMRARYYNVDIKRFMNQDVIVGSVESSPSLNRYAYVEGNPVNYLDPFGLEKASYELATATLHQQLSYLATGFMIISFVLVGISIIAPEAIPVTLLTELAVICMVVGLAQLLLYTYDMCTAGDYNEQWFDGLEGFGWTLLSLGVGTYSPSTEDEKIIQWFLDPIISFIQEMLDSL